MRQPEVLVISTQHPLAQQRHWSWDSLQGEAWIGHLPGTRTRALHDQLWAKHGLPAPTNQIVCGDAMLSLALLRRMPLLAILSRSLARFAAQQGLVKILPLEADLGLAELSVWHLRSPQSPWVAEFKRLLASAAREVEAA